MTHLLPKTDLNYLEVSESDSILISNYVDFEVNDTVIVQEGRNESHFIISNKIHDVPNVKKGIFVLMLNKVK